jgi:hypothetical protein
MGLLNKAGSTSTLDQDGLGKTLRDRLTRLSPSRSSPYTALSLLKNGTYFKIGICLSLKNNAYTSYATVGLGMQKIQIPLESINQIAAKSEPHKKFCQFYRFESNASPVISEQFPYTVFFFFPLDDKKPGGCILLVKEEEPPFNIELIDYILSQTKQTFVTTEDMPPVPGDIQNPPDTSVEKVLIEKNRNRIQTEIDKFQDRYPVFYGIVLKGPPGAKANEDFTARISAMIRLFGICTALPGFRQLLLLPGNADKELIQHRLSKSLNTEPILSFKADTTEKALALVKNYIDG